jgi:acyl-CoA reductase-like NAD-dependent aldehyde dehydrogenase
MTTRTNGRPARSRANDPAGATTPARQRPRSGDAEEIDDSLVASESVEGGARAPGSHRTPMTSVPRDAGSIAPGELGMLLGGEIVHAPSRFAVLNPATEEVLAQAPQCSFDMLDAAVGAARAALPAWRSDEGARRRALRASAQVLRQHADELAELFTREQGRARVYAKGEIEHSAWWLEQVAELALPGGEHVDDGDGRWELRREPRGVVAAITPWNFPILTAVTKLGPALLMGNTAVLKPSEYTPLTTLAMGHLLADVLPHGVLNIVCGLGVVPLEVVNAADMG